MSRSAQVPPWATASRAKWAIAALFLTLGALQLADMWLYAIDDSTKPDLRFGYTHAEIMALYGGWGADGRRAYAVGLMIDTAYPVALAAATVLLSARAFGRSVRWLWIPPLTFGILDVVENALLAAALLAFPDGPPALVAISSPITQVKLLSFPPTVALIVAAAVALGVRWARR